MTRNETILARFDAGETLEAIGQDFNLTRERVRQIVAKHGRAPRLKTIRTKRQKLTAIVVRLNERGLTNSQIAKEIGRPYGEVSLLLRKAGGECNRMSLDEHLSMLRLAAKVANGTSIRRVCNADHALSEKLRRFCKANGVVSAHRKVKDTSARAGLIVAGRIAGKSWGEITQDVAAVEGRTYCVGAIMNWARENVDLPGRPKSHRPVVQRREKPASPPQPETDLSSLEIAGLSVREAAMALRGIASASQIAKHLGISRNAVIGHWWRSRNGNRRSLSENHQAA